MWPIGLSTRLPIVGLVGRRPANCLMGRDPILPRLPAFPGPPCGGPGASGISPAFAGLSRWGGQVGHVLLTRSPLYHRPRAGYSFDLHVLGTPPAFILSQDQTLRRKGRPGAPRRGLMAPFRILLVKKESRGMKK
jgi:hypothetical protein